MTLFTVLTDTREQRPWEFSEYPVDTTMETLATGDYTLEQFCGYDTENDTYFPRLAVERKSGNDFLSSITHRRETFKDEIKRASDWIFPMQVVIEEPYWKFEQNFGFMDERQITPSQVEGTIQAWQSAYNVRFIFTENRQKAQQHAFDTLVSWYRKKNRS